MKATPKIDDKRWRKVRAAVARLGTKIVQVGIVGASADEDEDGITLGRLAGVHEYGAAIRMPGGTILLIPERSFIRASIKENERAYSDVVRGFAKRVLDGSMSEERALGLLGVRAVADMQRRISRGIDPPNAQSTIDRKGSSKPLIDTGRLRQGLSWLVVAKRGTT